MYNKYMNIKRAVGIVFVLYVVDHIINIIISKLLGIDLETQNPANMPLVMWYCSLIILMIMSTLGTAWYLNAPKIVSSIKNGFLFGLTIVVFGFIASTILLLISRGGLDILLEYYIQPQFWLAFILALIACTLVGYIKTRK
ncbi:hypothetical protein ACFL14_01665 [Patescibacteria group bacterium]